MAKATWVMLPSTDTNPGERRSKESFSYSKERLYRDEKASCSLTPETHDELLESLNDENGTVSAMVT